MLKMSRAKPRPLWLRGAYFAKRLATRVVPRDTLSRFLLNTAWLSHRFAFEIIGEGIGHDFYNAHFGITESLLRSLIKPSDTVLDVGSGTGRLAFMCAPFAKEVVGIDYEPTFIDRSRQKAPVNCRFVLGDVTKDLQGRFNIAILAHILEHIDNPTAFLTSIPADTVVVELPDFNANCLNSVRAAMGVPFFSDGDHVCEYTAESLLAELEKAGLIVESITSRNGNLVAVAKRNSAP